MSGANVIAKPKAYIAERFAWLTHAFPAKIKTCLQVVPFAIPYLM
jgi:hypothetical protein